MQTLIRIFAEFAWPMFRETWVILFGFLCGGLCVPREWLQLPAEEERRRARAQLKGQGPF